jgi:hypothetical protein
MLTGGYGAERPGGRGIANGCKHNDSIMQPGNWRYRRWCLPHSMRSND